MLRDKSLIPLSHQHQHALALCVRIDRASPIRDADLGLWLDEVSQLVRGEISGHFQAEELVVFPAVRRFEELGPLVEELLAEHAALRASFALAESRNISASELHTLAQSLSAHIRKEERRLFEPMQQLIRQEDLAELGRALEAALQSAETACILPREETRLRPRKE